MKCLCQWKDRTIWRKKLDQKYMAYGILCYRLPCRAKKQFASNLSVSTFLSKKNQVRSTNTWELAALRTTTCTYIAQKYFVYSKYGSSTHCSISLHPFIQWYIYIYILYYRFNVYIWYFAVKKISSPFFFLWTINVLKLKFRPIFCLNVMKSFDLFNGNYKQNRQLYSLRLVSFFLQ